jgi:hypothetical protein
MQWHCSHIYDCSACIYACTESVRTEVDGQCMTQLNHHEWFTEWMVKLPSCQHLEGVYTAHTFTVSVATGSAISDAALCTQSVRPSLRVCASHASCLVTILHATSV